MAARLLRAVWFVCVLTAAGLIPTSAQQDVKYVKLGGTLEVLPRVPPITVPITSVMWKHNADKAAEWDEDDGPDVDYYGPYKHRTHLNKTTFKLVVKKMTIIDDGLYSVEINGRMQHHTFKTKFIVDVPKPVVVLKPLTCTTDDERCFLVCEGNIEDAGPVTYRWNTSVNGEVKWTNSSQTEQLAIFNNEEGKTIKTFSCEMKNPVGEMLSDPHKNLFYVDPTQPNTVAVVLGVVLGLLSLLLLLVGGLVFGVKTSEPFRNRIPSTVTDRFPGPLKRFFPEVFPEEPLPAPLPAPAETDALVDVETVAGNGVTAGGDGAPSNPIEPTKPSNASSDPAPAETDALVGVEPVAGNGVTAGGDGAPSNPIEPTKPSNASSDPAPAETDALVGVEPVAGNGGGHS